MSRYRNTNIRKFIKKPNIDVGIIIFGVIFLYIIASLIIYITSTKTTIYEVGAGSLAQNNLYTGFILRNEKLVSSEYSGSINYFINSEQRAGLNTIIYTVDETGRVSDMINSTETTNISQNDFTEIRNMFTDLTLNYNPENYSNIYTEKNKIYNKLYEYKTTCLIDNLDSYINQTDDSDFFHKVTPDTTGVIVFSSDGYENYTENDLSYKLFNNKENNFENLQTNTIINAGDVAYKLIYNDDWSIYIPVDESEAAEFSKSNCVDITLTDTDISCTVPINIININGESFAKLSMTKYLVNFTDSRFINVEISQLSKSGLKIPASSVLTKNFYTIPIEYISGSNTFIRKYYQPSGEEVTEAVDATIYGSDDMYYYVSMDDFSSGDRIMKADSDDVYIIGTIGELEGVYCVNKGYSQFKKIEVIDKSSEYYIIKRNTKFGLNLYDHIVLNYKTVKENQLMN